MSHVISHGLALHLENLRLSFCAADVADHLMALINVGSHAANHADALHTGTNAVRWNQADRQV